jgi:hypothetical protein
MKRLSIISTGFVAGLISGIMWFWIGEILDNLLGNFIAWYVAPAILPLLIAGILWIRKYNSLMTSLNFFVIYYSFHWLPMLVLILYFWVFDIKM